MMTTNAHVVTEIDWDAEPLPDEPSNRWKYCGRKFKKINPKNPDQMIEFTYICDDHRKCTWCCHEKAVKERQVILKGMHKENSTKLIVTILTNGNVKQFNRQLREKNMSYREYPQPDGHIIAVHCDETQEGQVIHNPQEFDDLPLEKWISDIPVQRRVSSRGHMIAAKATKKELDEDYIQVWTFALWTDAPRVDDKICWHKAVEQTEIDEGDFQKSIGNRMRKYKHLLEERGFVTYCVPVRVIISLDTEDIPQREKDAY